MLIIIAGDGDTGTHLAALLSGENQDVVVIGSNREHLTELADSYNFITVAGNPTDMDDLMKFGADRAQLFIAVTPDEYRNIIACQMAKRCGTKICVARVDSSGLSSGKAKELFAEYGIDRIFLPEFTAAESIAHFIAASWMSECMQLRQGALSIVGVRLEKDSLLCGRTLSEASMELKQFTFHVAAIRRGERVIIPRGDDKVQAGDILYFSMLPDTGQQICELCGKDEPRLGRIMITGGGRITENLLRILGNRYKVTVLEADRERCHVLASLFPHTVIVNSTADDVATLKDEGIDNCDLFLALTGNSEANMVSCMVAREHGVRKTVARIEEIQYIPEAESLSIDKIVNKKRLNTGKVLDLMLDAGNEAGGQCLSMELAEVATVMAREGTRIVSAPICKLSIPRSITIAGLIRDNRGMLVNGSTQIQPGDMVVVIFLEGHMGAVSRLFK